MFRGTAYKLPTIKTILSQGLMMHPFLITLSIWRLKPTDMNFGPILVRSVFKTYIGLFEFFCKLPWTWADFKLSNNPSSPYLLDTWYFVYRFCRTIFRTSIVNKSILNAVEQLTDGPIVIATEHATVNVVINALEAEVFYYSSPPCTVVFNSSNCFSASTVMNVMKQYWVAGKRGLNFTPVPNSL